MLLPHGAVIVLADGKAWEIYRNAGNEAAPELTALPVPHLVEQNHGSGTRHGSSSGNPSGHQLDEDAHAAAVAAWLNAKVASRQIEHAVVIAAPRTLGELRLHYHTQLKSVLLAELSKDLVGLKGPEIVAALREKNT